jgi:hypothetical protein
VHWLSAPEQALEESLKAGDLWAGMTKQLLDGVMKRRT